MKYGTTRFPQHAYAESEAIRLGLKNADDFYVRRSLKIFRILKHLGNSSRFVRVLSGQAVNTWRTKQLLDLPNIGKYIDAYSLAPYFGYQEQLVGKNKELLDFKTASVDTIFNRLEHALTETQNVIRANAVLARQAGLPFNCVRGLDSM